MNAATSTPEPISRPRLARAPRPAGFKGASDAECFDLLRTLYRTALERRPEDPYLRFHSQPNSIRRQVDAFNLYKSFLPTSGVILEWGCKHAPDACLMRLSLGDQVRLLGHDFERGDNYREFHEYAGLQTTVADHIYRLPFEDESVNVVVASGVLEHAALPGESLKELYRVLKNGGLLVITFLPNRLSYTEFIHRWALKQGHRRLYSRRLISSLLLNHGFDPQLTRYHQFIPAQRGSRLFTRLWFLNPGLERCWPFNRFCANIFAVGMKRLAI